MSPSLDRFDAQMKTSGWAMFERAVSPDALTAIGDDVTASVADCAERQVRSGAVAAPDGTAHHAVGAYRSLDCFLENLPLKDEIGRYFGGAPYILHAFNPATVAPQRSSYLHRIHRDVRTHAGDFRLLLNMLVMVDDFTSENGATYVLSGSHRHPEPPSDAEFFDKADRLVGTRGSIVLFDSNLWHAAGANQTATPRRALTLSFSRAFVKQQMDYPRFLGAETGARQSEWMRQLLGYNAMTPNSYEEFYRPPAQRLYRADQG